MKSINESTSKNINVRITFTEPLLGTAPADEYIYETYVRKNAPDAATLEEEISTLGADAVIEKGMTVFHRSADGAPILYDYQIKGFFKDTCGALARVKTTESAKLRAYKKIIDGLIFPYPRQIKLVANDEIKMRQRPLRANTPVGEKTALAICEELPAGTTCEFAITLLDPAHERVVREWLDYGALRGMGQWRNSGAGRFTWVEVTASEAQEASKVAVA